MKRKNQGTLDPNAPLLHAAHKRPVSRRDFIAQGLMAGAASVFGGSVFSLFANPRQAQAALAPDIAALRDACGIATQGAGKIPFICFDLAGGANIAGSNVLVGGPGGQEDFLRTEGYSKLGLPSDMVPKAVAVGSTDNSFVNTDMKLAFHSDSAFLRGILSKTSPAALANTDGCVIPAVSENDTANNPHNPMYGINKYGANGSLLGLIGSVSSDSGGNSMAPAYMINTANRPTKVDRPSDVTGLVDVGDLTSILSQADAVAVMESIERISARKLPNVSTGVTRDEVIKDLVQCGYVKSADLADRFGNPQTLNPFGDPDIVGAGGIFSSTEFNNDGEFQKTASVMKLVINGFAGAGTVTMGGFDYHTGDRATGEVRDFRAGQCMGACIEYAHRVGMPLMLYVFSDGSLSSNGMIDASENGRGKGQWTGDNSSTASVFYLVYNPNGAMTLNTSAYAPRQLGYMRPDASVETSATVAANSVTTLAETIVLNYMALHNQQGQFTSLFPNSAIGTHNLEQMIAFEPIVNGTIGA